MAGLLNTIQVGAGGDGTTFAVGAGLISVLGAGHQRYGPGAGRGITSGERATRWDLWSEEIDVRVLGAFEARVVDIDYGVQLNEGTSAMLLRGYAVPAGHRPKSVSVGFEFRARDYTDDIRPVIADLERLHAVDPALYRPPIVRLRWGSIEIEGFLRLQLRYVDGAYQMPPHYPRAVVGTITVVEIEPRVLEKTSDPAPETRYRRVGPGETFESVAMTMLGDPMLGVLLRRINVHVTTTGLSDGDIVKVLDPDHPKMLQSTGPASPALVGYVRPLLQSGAEERLSRRGPGLVALEAELGL